MTTDLFEAAPMEIYTDGACSGNPGPGGWGVLIRQGGEERSLCGGEPDTTNNRMEMQAAIEALRAVPEGGKAVIVTDSSYVKNGITSWISGWKRRGWKTADNKPVKNQDLWQALDALQAGRKIDWRWVKGHAGNEGNEKADELARDGMMPFLPESQRQALMKQRTAHDSANAAPGTVQSPPRGLQSIIPMLNYADCDAAIDFLETAFGFRPGDIYPMPDGRIGHAELTLGGNTVMVASVFPEMAQTTPKDAGGWYSQVFCYVDDVDAHFEKAKAAGATITAEPADQFSGDRHYRAEDPEGHRWIFGTHVKDVPPDEIRAIMQKM